MIIIRPATAADQKRIIAIIREAQINPMDLKWSNFILAVDDATGEIVGTAQIKTHRDKSRELASIATISAYQHQGIATRLIQHWLANSTGPLYLMCMPHMGTFYERFGFRPLIDSEMPPYFRRLTKLARVFEVVSGETQLLVMRRDSLS
jgi:N-acetylglutamate synthase-like GNAT family acetyltransferase